MKRKPTGKEIITGLVIPPNTLDGFGGGNPGYWESTPIENENFTKMRVYADVTMSAGATEPLTVDLYYRDLKIAEVLRIPSGKVSSGGISATVDIAGLSNFRLTVINHDTHDMTVQNLRLVLWEEE